MRIVGSSSLWIHGQLKVRLSPLSVRVMDFALKQSFDPLVMPFP